MKKNVVLRVARPTSDLEATVHFYRDGLGFDELARFENHDGFDGVMLGKPDEAHHFEFTRAHGHDAGRAPTQDIWLYSTCLFPTIGRWRLSA